MVWPSSPSGAGVCLDIKDGHKKVVSEQGSKELLELGSISKSQGRVRDQR